MATTMIIARLNDRTLPMDRGELYEDPLDEVLKKHQLGEVTGGGTQLGENREVVFVDVEIQLRGSVDKALSVITSTLEELGAPKGSMLIIDDKSPQLPFGKNEGLAVYLNGTDLPKEVYQESDVNFVFAEFNRLLGTDGRIHSYWEGPEETALYVYGRSFARMEACLAGFLASYPLCRKARVVQIA
jgi:hypothetical protein